MEQRQPTDREEPALPAGTTRTILSLVIFVHLFAVVVALAAYARPSELVQRLRRFAGPYVQTLAFDLSYRPYTTARLYQTHNAVDDVEARIELELDDGDDQTDDKTTVRVPREGLWPPARRRRYQSLANVASDLGRSENAVLLQSISAALLAETGKKAGVIRAWAHVPQSREDRDSSDPKRREPNSPTFFERSYADNELLLVGDSVMLKPRDTKLESAPVRKEK